jgi:hypothetical protein
MLLSSLHAGNFDKDQLIAWCIVPFDAKQRGPAERAKMLVRLGIKRVAYDWREKHVKDFEEEILQYKKHGLEFFAFWGEHEDAFRLFQKHRIQPQIWQTLRDPIATTQKARVKATATAILPLVNRTRELGCALGLYNHGGWGGEPANLVAVCNYLQTNHRVKHVGIVYNLHHAHKHIMDFEKSLKLMLPYLLCINLNGMNERANPKVLPIGQGEHEVAIINTIRQSCYKNPIGILDHRSDTDTAVALSENLAGLGRLLKNTPIKPKKQGSPKAALP